MLGFQPTTKMMLDAFFYFYALHFHMLILLFAQDGNSPLHRLLEKEPSQSLGQLCIALLQCGADIRLPNEVGFVCIAVWCFPL
jgi:hypothetical protein